MDVLWDSDPGSDDDAGAGGEVVTGGASGCDSDAEGARPAGSDDEGDGAGAGADVAPVADDDAAPPELSLVEEFVAREDVIARIEGHTAALLRGLAERPPRVPELELASRRQAGATTKKRLTSNRDGAGVVRVWRVLAECHGNLQAGRSATQRELYCACAPASASHFIRVSRADNHLTDALADGETVRSAAEVNTAIQDCVALLQVPRACLGITCASRGAVAGRLQIKEDNAWSDLAASARGHAIPGDMAWVAGAVLRSDAAYILVVEKDAVFNRLLQERACERLGAVMITARGQPDLASRAFLARLSGLLPHAPVLALVDWNPSGVLILATYRVGSLRMGLEAGRYAVPVRWLAARHGDLAHRPDEDLLPLTPRDEVLIRNMLAAPRLGAAGPAVAAELRAMAQRGRKAELEALYNSDADSSLTDVLLPKILRQDYI